MTITPKHVIWPPMPPYLEDPSSRLSSILIQTQVLNKHNKPLYLPVDCIEFQKLVIFVVKILNFVSLRIHIISQLALSPSTYCVAFAWNSLSLANMVATKVSLSPLSQRLSIVLIWSFHPHCLNMGYPSDRSSDLCLTPLPLPQHAARSPIWWRTGAATADSSTTTNQSQAWKCGIYTRHFLPASSFFTV